MTKLKNLLSRSGFIDGFMSTLDLFPSDQFSILLKKTDSEKIAEDWKRVGGYLRVSIKKIDDKEKKRVVNG